MFCASHESIDHLFFSCPVAHYIWSVFQCAFNTPAQPTSVAELGEWVLKFQGLRDQKGWQLKFAWHQFSGLYRELGTKHVLIILCPMIVVISFII